MPTRGDSSRDRRESPTPKPTPPHRNIDLHVSPLNLISTPVPVLNTLGLNIRVGLSSEDPMVVRHPTEAYEAYLSIYSPEGLLLGRQHLGEIAPYRRRFFDISAVTRQLVTELDHLTVVHRIPTRLLSTVSNLEDEIEMPSQPDYSLFRSLIEYSFPHGGNGSVIYETPHKLNAGTEGHKSSNTLTFTCQTILSESVNTYVILIHYSVTPSYTRIANYNFGLHSLSGEQVVSERLAVGPFSIKVLDIAQLIPEEVADRVRDPQDGMSAFTFVGSCDDAAIPAIVVNAAPNLGAVSVEHTHPPQTYLFPQEPSYQREMKVDAQKVWKSILSAGRSG